MPEYRIFETAEFQKRLGKLPPEDVAFLRRKLKALVYPQLRAAPFWGKNIKKLRGYNPDTWRYRIGRFRLFHAVDAEARVVYILTIEQRKDAYR